MIACGDIKRLIGSELQSNFRNWHRFSHPKFGNCYTFNSNLAEKVVSLNLTHTYIQLHTHTHTHTYIYIYTHTPREELCSGRGAQGESDRDRPRPRVGALP